MTRFSIVTTVFDPDPAHLAACLDSVDGQTLADWEHVVVDDASTDEGVIRLLAERSTHPQRRLVRRRRNGGIVAAGNDGLAAASGDHVVLLDHDDVLAPVALERFATAIDAAIDAAIRPGIDTTVDVLYSDHDLLRPDGRPASPVFKPEFSPERLRNHNYITHLVAVRRQLALDLGGFRAGLDGAQDHDLLLRATEGGRSVVHVPEILAHWRQAPASVAADTGNKPAAYAAGARAVADQLDRLGLDADVTPGAYDGVYRIRRRIVGEPLVSVVIPTRGAVGRVWGCARLFVHDAVASLVGDDTLRSRLELVIVLDPAPPVVEAGLRRIVDGRLPPERLVVVPYDRPFDFPAKIAAGVSAASGEYLLLLNDDTELLTAGSVDEMVGLAQQSDVGMVGAKLLYEDGTLQHGGHVYNGTIDHAFRGWSGDHPGPQRLLAVERECAGVTAAAALLRREVYEEVGGMATDLPMNYNDVDLAMRVRASGRRIVWTPHACWYHFESRTTDHPIEPWELERLLSRWPEVLSDDPYSNPNLLPGRADWLERPGRSGAPPYVVLPDGRRSWA